jgi:hypothetical protein
LSERVGTALRAFAHPTLANPPYVLMLSGKLCKESNPMRVVLPIAIVLVATIGAAMAQQKNVLPVMGAGNASCARFASDYRKNSETIEELYFSWAQGMMSGINLGLLALNRPIRDLNAWRVDDEEAHIRQFCDHRPLSSYSDAVNSLFRALPEVSPQSK